MANVRIRFKQKALVWALLVVVCVGLMGVSLAKDAAHQERGKATVSVSHHAVQPVMHHARIDGHLFKLEDALTPQQQAQGLMFRRALPQRYGMRFVFDTPRLHHFWMKNCFVPLDMLFVHEGYIVDLVKNAPPCQLDPCPVYHSSQPAEWVIELEGGTAKKLDLKLRDTVTLLHP